MSYAIYHTGVVGLVYFTDKCHVHKPNLACSMCLLGQVNTKRSTYCKVTKWIEHNQNLQIILWRTTSIYVRTFKMFWAIQIEDCIQIKFMPWLHVMESSSCLWTGWKYLRYVASNWQRGFARDIFCQCSSGSLDTNHDKYCKILLTMKPTFIIIEF